MLNLCFLFCFFEVTRQCSADSPAGGEGKWKGDGGGSMGGRQRDEPFISPSNNAYGEEPWLFYGNPIASPRAIVYSSLGTARFTVLTSRLIRIEGPPPFEDGRTLIVWNRNLTIPVFTTNTTGSTTTIDTGDFGVLLEYIDDGTGLFTSTNLKVQRRTPFFGGVMK